MPENRDRLATRRAVEQGDLKKVEQSLTARQRRFCHEYVKDFNKRAAVIRAGYTTAYPDRQGINLFKNAGVLALIEELKTSNKFAITAVDPNYVIQGITKIVSDPNAKHTDQLRGLELLAKHLGMLTDKQEITGKDGGPLSLAREEVEQEANEIIGLLRGLHSRVESDKADKEKRDGNVVDFAEAKKSA